jgi:hypothetical protein
MALLYSCVGVNIASLPALQPAVAAAQADTSDAVNILDFTRFNICYFFSSCLRTFYGD